MPAPAVRRNFGKSPRMDATDRKILRLSQEDATRPVTDALRVGLRNALPAAHPKTGRIRRRAGGASRRRQAEGRRHGPRQDRQTRRGLIRAFSEAVREFPEAVESCRMSGDVDYPLRVVVPGIAAYDRRRPIEKAEIYDASSSFSTERIKTALPLNYG